VAGPSRLRLFPLNTVLFPGAALNLHIFEPRYRQMIAECLDGNEAFGVVLIREGEEAGDPEVQPHDIGTTAEISEVTPLPAGRYYLCAMSGSMLTVWDRQYTGECPSGAPDASRAIEVKAGQEVNASTVRLTRRAGVTVTVALGDGKSTRADQWGESGPVLLCVHGITSSRRSWERFAQHFAAVMGHHIIALFIMEEHCARGCKVAFFDEGFCARRQLVFFHLDATRRDFDLALAIFNDDMHSAVNVRHNCFALGIARLKQFFDTRETGGNVLRARDATRVERAQRQLSARLTDGLRRNHADRFAHTNQATAREIATIAFRAETVALSAGQWTTREHAVHFRFLHLLPILLGDHLTRGHNDLAGLLIHYCARRDAPDHAFLE